MDEPERDVVSHELPEEREFALETRPASGRSSPGRCAASSRIQREHLQLSSSDEQLTMTSAAGELAKFDWRPMADGRALGDAKNDLGGIPRTTGTRNPGAEVGRAVLVCGPMESWLDLDGCMAPLWRRRVLPRSRSNWSDPATERCTELSGRGPRTRRTRPWLASCSSYHA